MCQVTDDTEQKMRPNLPTDESLCPYVYTPSTSVETQFLSASASSAAACRTNTRSIGKDFRLWLVAREWETRRRTWLNRTGARPLRLVEDPRRCTSALARNLPTMLGIVMKCGDTAALRPRRRRTGKQPSTCSRTQTRKRSTLATSAARMYER